MTWSEAGREVLVAMPKAGFGKDANDALQKRSDAGEDVLDFDPEQKGVSTVAEVIAEAETIETGTISQDALARIFANRYVDRLRYCHSTGSWFEWSGSHWEQDTKVPAPAPARAARPPAERPFTCQNGPQPACGARWPLLRP